MNIKYKMHLYDILYLAGSILIKIFNPCKIHMDKAGNVVCKDGNDLCCTRCYHLGDKGCTVKALSCKLWLCQTARLKYSRLEYILRKLAAIADKSGLYYIRASKSEIRNKLEGG